MVRYIYYAVNKSGQGSLFLEPPKRDLSRGVWRGEMVGSVTSAVLVLFGDVVVSCGLRWHDEPARLEISLEIKIDGD